MNTYINSIFLVFFLIITSMILSCSENTPNVSKKNQSNFMEKSYITRGAVTAAHLQLYVIEYNQENGFMPKNNAALKLEPPNALARDALKSIEIINGHIILTYNEKSGIDNGQIVFSPTIDFEVRWLCKTDTFKGIEEFMPQCVFQNTPLIIDELTKL